MWNVGENYKITEFIGKGAYSIVAAGIHVPTGKKVAIKRIVDLLNKKHEALRILREVVLLRMLDHPNIIKLYEIVVPDMTHFNEIYLIEEYYPRDIKKLLRTNLFLTM
jgi:serine/threonine protein kinase